jgi:hypothetical protein
LTSRPSQEEKVREAVKKYDEETQSLVKTMEGGHVDLDVTWEENEMRLRITPVGIPDGVEKIQFMVWQDWEAIINRQKSPLMRLTVGNTETWKFNMRVKSLIVGNVFLTTSAGHVSHQAGFTLQAQTPAQTQVGVRKYIGDRAGTLAIKSLSLSHHGCKAEPTQATSPRWTSAWRRPRSRRRCATPSCGTCLARDRSSASRCARATTSARAPRRFLAG